MKTTDPDVTRQLTVRFPALVWTDLTHEMAVVGTQSMNDVVVAMVASELTRRQRARVLADLARQRAEVARAGAAAEDSTRYIRSLREGLRDDG